jgi:hypothetical protein
MTSQHADSRTSRPENGTGYFYQQSNHHVSDYQNYETDGHNFQQNLSQYMPNGIAKLSSYFLRILSNSVAGTFGYGPQNIPHLLHPTSLTGPLPAAQFASADTFGYGPQTVPNPQYPTPLAGSLLPAAQFSPTNTLGYVPQSTSNQQYPTSPPGPSLPVAQFSPTNTLGYVPQSTSNQQYPTSPTGPPLPAAQFHDAQDGWTRLNINPPLTYEEMRQAYQAAELRVVELRNEVSRLKGEKKDSSACGEELAAVEAKMDECAPLFEAASSYSKSLRAMVSYGAKGPSRFLGSGTSVDLNQGNRGVRGAVHLSKGIALYPGNDLCVVLKRSWYPL